jgi:RNA polymerase sigma-70 factor (ECF subfamily)
VPSDVELVRRVREGDISAFDELVRRYAGSIFRVAYMMVRNHADADDITQETFVRAFKSIHTFDERFRLYTWLRRIAVNLSFNCLKARGRQRMVSLPLVDEDGRGCDIPDPSPGCEAAGLRHDLELALNKLPPEQRAVFTLHVLEGMDYKEISRSLKIPLGTVMSRLNRARLRLRQLLKEYMPRR